MNYSFKFYFNPNTIETIYGRGQGKLEKSTGPPRPASASRRDMITAIAASSLPSVGAGGACSLDSLDPTLK